MQPYRPTAALALALAAAACAGDPTPLTGPAASRPSLVVVPTLPATLVDGTTQGYYNAAIGNKLNGTSAAFPTATDPAQSFASAPDLGPAASILGGWLSASPLPLNANWSGPQAIPATWDVNSETAVVYELAVPTQGATCTRLTGSFGVDNGIFVWLDGEYRFGRMDPGGAGSFEYPNVDLGTVSAGIHYLQVLREDHGGSTGYAVRVDAFSANRKPKANAGGPYAGVEGSPVAVTAAGSTDPDAACGDGVDSYQWASASLLFGPISGVPTASLVYVDNGAYTAAVRIQDRNGLGDTAYAAVTIANAPPKITLVKLDVGVLNSPFAGQSFPVAFTFTDPGAADAPWAWTAEWGDGSVGTGAATARGDVNLSHRYAGPGTYTLRFTIRDKDGASASRSIPVVVRPIPS